MKGTFHLSFDKIQPSQLYISRKRLDSIKDAFKMGLQDKLEPIPIKEIDGEFVATDGHTRGLVWFLHGAKEVEVIWEDIEMDWDAYRIFVDWCKEEKITQIPDLKDRIISDDDFQVMWIERCQSAEKDLASKR